MLESRHSIVIYLTQVSRGCIKDQRLKVTKIFFLRQSFIYWIGQGHGREEINPKEYIWLGVTGIEAFNKQHCSVHNGNRSHTTMKALPCCSEISHNYGVEESHTGAYHSAFCSPLTPSIWLVLWLWNNKNESYIIIRPFNSTCFSMSQKNITNNCSLIH